MANSLSRTKYIDLPELSLDTLPYFAEDPQLLSSVSLDSIKQSILPGMIIAFLAMFGLPLFFFLNAQAVYVVTGLVIGGAILIWKATRKIKRTPVSPTTGKPLERYWNSSPSGKVPEIIYLCRESKTYCIYPVHPETRSIWIRNRH